MSNELQKAEQRVVTAEAVVGAAERVVADLEVKRAAGVQRGTELAGERASVALAAHTGDEMAAKRLQEIHQAIAVHGSELASLDAALKAAGAKVEAARAAVARETQKVDAIKLRTVSRAFVATLRKLDGALDNFADWLDDAEGLREQLSAFGVGPSFEQFVVLGERPLLAALAETVFEGRIGRRLAPRERMSWADLAAEWTRSHEVAVARILGEQQTNTEAA